MTLIHPMNIPALPPPLSMRRDQAGDTKSPSLAAPNLEIHRRASLSVNIGRHQCVLRFGVGRQASALLTEEVDRVRSSTKLQTDIPIKRRYWTNSSGVSSSSSLDGADQTRWRQRWWRNKRRHGVTSRRWFSAEAVFDCVIGCVQLLSQLHRKLNTTIFKIHFCTDFGILFQYFQSK